MLVLVLVAVLVAAMAGCGAGAMRRGLATVAHAMATVATVATVAMATERTALQKPSKYRLSPPAPCGGLAPCRPDTNTGSAVGLTTEWLEPNNGAGMAAERVRAHASVQGSERSWQTQRQPWPVSRPCLLHALHLDDDGRLGLRS